MGTDARLQPVDRSEFRDKASAVLVVLEPPAACLQQHGHSRSAVVLLTGGVGVRLFEEAGDILRSYGWADS
jgi:hypothetical protein